MSGHGQTIFRNASASKQFTSILNATLQDGSLSPEAGWVLMLVLSLPTDWAVHLEWIAKRRRMGRDRTRAAVKELELHKYCKRRRTRGPGGKIGPYEFVFTDLPGAFGDDDAAPAPERQGVVQTQHKRASIPPPEDQGVARTPADRGSAPRPDLPAPGFQSPTKDLVSLDKKKDLIPQTSTACSQAHEDASDGLIPFDDETDLGSNDPGLPIDYASEAIADAGVSRQCLLAAPAYVRGKAGNDHNPAYRGVRALLQHGQEKAARSQLPPAMADKWRLTFTSRTIALIRRMCVDVEALAARYFEKTCDLKIDDPNAYLFRMAQEVVEKREGISPGEVALIAAAARKSGKAAQKALEAARVPARVDPTQMERIRRTSAARPGDAIRAAIGSGRQ